MHSGTLHAPSEVRQADPEVRFGGGDRRAIGRRGDLAKDEVQELACMSVADLHMEFLVAESPERSERLLLGIVRKFDRHDDPGFSPTTDRRWRRLGEQHEQERDRQHGKDVGLPTTATAGA
jgi:hypothetical protein